VKRVGLLAGIVLGCLGAATLSRAAVAQRASDDLSTASLEQLTQIHIRVSSFARRDEDLWKTPAAVFVITKEDIARSSVSSIPELLRMVPGIQVAQIDASSWAVSARGFNSAFADKLLVLIDGRPFYSEAFSGAPWDQIDLPLEDIERIEVIRGPGAAAWGTNAVNGVINIITKKARGTTGLRVSDNLSRIGETADIRHGAAWVNRPSIAPSQVTLTVRPSIRRRGYTPSMAKRLCVAGDAWTGNRARPTGSRPAATCMAGI
jgi:iron complex outermembrane receptor protein